MSINYQAVCRDLIAILGQDAVTDDFHRRFAWSTDASYFRIVPKLVVKANNAQEVKQCLNIANKYNAPITFRAAGTSLSGQALGEGILLMLGFDGFNQITLNHDASTITLGSAVIGSDANDALKSFNKKIGPDPATLAVAKIGGIVANNSSGMCCGTSQNSYQTIASAKLIFADGTELDTSNHRSRAAFEKMHSTFLHNLTQLAKQTQINKALSERIRKKYAIKNTTGYSLNTLIDFTDPFDIINHLIVGSEGTLAFVEEVTYHTVNDAPFKASALAVFYDIETAATAIPVLSTQNVSSVELLDYASIEAITGEKSMPQWLNTLPKDSAILLIETRANSQEELNQSTMNIVHALTEIPTVRPIEFTDDAEIYAQYWAMRSALFPIVASKRAKNTSVIIEDIAFEIDNLAAAARDLTALFKQYGYDEGIIFGHALAGNFHFVITPCFDTEKDVERFGLFMQAVSEMVLNKYDGSMKAEHGTGRAVAPFVEMEWGKEAYQLMKEIKWLFDPKGILNPNVILSDDKTLHLKNIKTNASVDPLVDKCIDCGFCGKTCPTSALSMSPRQRIAMLREIYRLKAQGENEQARLLRKEADYDVVNTCISCELCNIACPVNIGMGELAHKLRAENRTTFEQAKLDAQANLFGAANQAIRTGLNLLNKIQHTAGSKFTDTMLKTARKFNKDIPNWNTSFPKAAELPKNTNSKAHQQSVIYFPACGGRLFGATPQDTNTTSLPMVVETLLDRAGFNVIIPKNAQSLCCGQLWQSKGDMKNANAKYQEFVEEVLALAQHNKVAVIIDALSCTHRILTENKSFNEDIEIYDLVDFIHDNLLSKLSITHKKPAVTLHLGCSARKLSIEPKMQAIVEACAHHIVYPKGIHCCGYAGEKGMYMPEISATALRNLKVLIPENVKEGYYANRMCELGLTQHSDISYRHIAYLVEECTRTAVSG